MLLLVKNYIVYVLPHCNTLVLPKLKAVAGNNLDTVEVTEYAFERVEKIVGNGKNAGFQFFSSFHTMFSMTSFRVIKSWDCVVNG